MARGRRPQSAEFKALKGNPGKRKLALENIAKPKLYAKPAKVVAPDYLTDPREREAFHMAFTSLPANIARKSDVHAMARWATWLRIWIDSKLALDGNSFYYENDSKHSKFWREHPFSKTMSNAEAKLITLEDRLGLNVVARNNVVNKLFSMPAPPPGSFADDTAQPDADSKKKKPVILPDASPLGFLLAAGKPN